VLRAWRSGGLLVINELDHASEDVSNLLHLALDNPAVARVTLPTGETVAPAKGFRCIATMNGGAVDIAPAILDRFSVVQAVTEPSAEMVAKLPDDLQPLVRRLYSAANARRTEDGEPEVTYREVSAFVRLRKRLPEPLAAMLACKSDRDKAASVVEAAWLQRVRVRSATAVKPRPRALVLA
jgi:MoxR-like ATPase